MSHTVVNLSDYSTAEQSALLKHGRPQGPLRVEIETHLLAVALRPTRGISSPVTKLPIRKTEWPPWAKALATQKIDSDTGVGDTAERVFGKFGGTLFNVMIKKLGMKCGCGERKIDWNREYPYLPPATAATEH